MLAPVDKASALGRWLPAANALSFLVMITVNALGSTGALSSLNVGQVSDKFATMITPASYAFSIWGVIYFSLAVFIVWGFLPGQRNEELLFHDIGYWFSLSCLFNTLWIIVFVQATVATLWISSVFLFLIVWSLVVILLRTNAWRRDTTRSTFQRFLDAFSVDWAFSIYAGWTTAASILNVSLSLVGSGFYGGDHQERWAKAILVVAGVVYFAVMLTRWNWAYGAAGAWALFAISKNSKTCQTVPNLLDSAASCDDIQQWASGVAISVTALAGVELIVFLIRLLKRKEKETSGANVDQDYQGSVPKQQLHEV